MRYTRILLTALAVTCGMTARGEAHVHWVETTHNFGAFVEETGPVTCEFMMVNDGPGEASIVAARATCGCTQPKYTVRSLAPGDTARLSVTYDPTGRPGRFNKPIYVETSGTPQKQKLEITGVVIGGEETVSRRFPVDMGPLKLATGGIMAGDVVRGHLKTVYTDGYNRSTDSLRVTVVSSPQWIEVIPSPAVAAPGEQVTLISYVNSSRCPVYGLAEDSVVISPAPGLRYTLPVTAMVSEDFSGLGAADLEKAPIAVLSAETLDYGTLTAGTMSRELTISNSGKNKLHVRRVYSPDPAVTATVSDDTIGRGKKATVTVSIGPDAVVDGLLNAQLFIITDDPLQPTRTVRLVGSR